LVRNIAEDVNATLSPKIYFVNVIAAESECKEKLLNRRIKRESKRKLGLGIVLKPTRLHG
jgi:hypothetical protein